jgi:hypothetical protein
MIHLPYIYQKDWVSKTRKKEIRLNTKGNIRKTPCGIRIGRQRKTKMKRKRNNKGALGKWTTKLSNKERSWSPLNFVR